MSERCSHRDVVSLSEPSPTSGEPELGWAWCRGCGAIFRLGTMHLPPVCWSDGAHGPIWLGLDDSDMWFLPPKGADGQLGWGCKHEEPRRVEGAGVGGLWRWCQRCGALWQSTTLPVAAWQQSVLVEVAFDIRGKIDGVYHHPRSHGLRARTKEHLVNMRRRKATKRPFSSEEE